MPHVSGSTTTLAYDLICYDAKGVERTDDPDGLMSERVLQVARQEPITDVFLMSHGWQGDIPSARQQYDAWVGVMSGAQADWDRARQRPGFRAQVIGLHWPSLPWGDEKLGAAGVAFSGGQPSSLENLVETYAQRIADTPPARQALRTIVAAGERLSLPQTLPDDARAAYRVLDQEAHLGSIGEGAAPGLDREPFDPEEYFQLARAEGLTFGISDVAGSVLTPLRQLSFWKMKDRGRRFGESGVHDLLRRLFEAQPGVRIHLMGHSFGCIVMSAAVAGPPGSAALPAPVQSLVLVQGALSLWSYCSDIPYRRGVPGYFQPVVAAGNRVAGPIVTTKSQFDLAVGRWYPLGAGVAREIVYDLNSLPQYGGVGTFGLRGPGLDIVDLPMQAADQAYAFEAGRIYNLESSGVIRKLDGASGAHSDIVHPEVAHAVWADRHGALRIEYYETNIRAEPEFDLFQRY